MRPRRAAAWILLAGLLLPAWPQAAHAADESAATEVAAAPDSAAGVPAGTPSPAFADTLLRGLAAGDRAGVRGLLRADRLQHGSLSFTLAASAGLGGRSRAEALACTLALGLVKELHDGRHGRFDPVDLAADLVGATLGAWAAARR